MTTTFTIVLDWWLLPLAVTLASFIGWRLFGARMEPNRGGMFPDGFGAMMELGGYLVAALISTIAWLIWSLL